MSVVSYNVEVINNTNKLRNIVANTLALYNSALNYVCDVVLRYRIKSYWTYFFI